MNTTKKHIILEFEPIDVERYGLSNKLYSIDKLPKENYNIIDISDISTDIIEIKYKSENGYTGFYIFDRFDFFTNDKLTYFEKRLLSKMDDFYFKNKIDELKKQDQKEEANKKWYNKLLKWIK